MPATPFDVLADEFGAVAGRIEREVTLRVNVALSELARKDLERELLLTKLLQEVNDRVTTRLATVKDGIDGKDGVPGRDGVDGIAGQSGIDGKDGINGSEGIDGKDGAPGLDGVDGTQGPAGADGKDGANGRDGIDGAEGSPGDPGAVGERGQQGEMGKDGAAGTPGRDGADGAVGPIGERGEVGERGMPGDAGRDGAPGERGADGLHGAQGERGIQGPEGPAGKLPVIKAWSEGVHYEADVVQHRGATYQAMRDTGKEPGESDDWICIAARGADGRAFTIRGTYAADKEFALNDIAACNGGSFVALKDAPGVCPGPDWQLIAGPGKRGEKGQPGERGLRGEKAEASPVIAGWIVDAKAYTAEPVMSDGTKGPAVEMRDMFEQFLNETK